ncbi:MAG: hypothetical protein GXO76_04455 [Calditrichaeota bacterium]|nr:hypothetical protein [Calditrichota bacterium]
MKRKHTFWTLLILFVFSSLILSAGSVKAEKPKKAGGLGYFMVGAATIDLSDLNAALHAAGYPKLSDRFLSMGGGGLAFINRLIIGGEGSGLSEASVTANGNRITLTGGYGMFEMGYLLFSAQKGGLYPLLGIGGGGLNLNLAEENQSVKFSEILNTPKGSVQLSSGAFLINLGLGGHYFLRSADRKGEASGFLVGFRLGYVLALTSKNWELQNGTVLDAPKTTFSGPYFQLTIGGGGQQFR